MSYWTLVILTLIIGFGAQTWVNSRLKKYQKVPVANGLTGADVAYRMLSYYGVQGVEVRCGSEGQDFFDPRSNSVTLSPSVYRGRSVTALATACHECGHAQQFATGYTPMRVRSAIVPVVNVASNAWIFLLMIGIAMNLAGMIDLAIIMYAAVVVFGLVTLPVEFDASHRALAYMGTIGLPEAEVAGSRSVLTACALTYVASVLTSILQLLWLLGQRED